MFIKSGHSLGIDISESRISVVLLSKLNNKIKLLKAADCPVPSGSIVDGNIENPGLLAKSIKSLLNKNRIRTRRAVVSLFAKPIFMQMLNLPKEIPENLGRYVQAEIKHSPLLSGKEPYYDYCGLGRTGPERNERVFVGATDYDKITLLMKTFTLAGIEPESVDLSALAITRAVYSKRIVGEFDKNVLMANVRDSSLTISVYHKGEMDFIRCIELDTKDIGSENHISQLSTEINTVIEYYEIEVDDAPEIEWDFFITFDECPAEIERIKKSFSEKLDGDVHICTPSTVAEYAAMEINTSIEEASTVAIGCALKKYLVQDLQIKINLLPPETEDVRSTKKYIRIALQVAVLIIVVMFGVGELVKSALGKTQQSIQKRRIENPTGNIELLLRKQQRIAEEIEFLTAKKSGMGDVFGEYSKSNWHELLDNIGDRVPASVYLEEMRYIENSKIILEGNSLSFKSIHNFAALLADLDEFSSASVAETNKSDTVGLISFTITVEMADN
ncbi:MAG: pilus assembly protein PilM [Sedimentisphaerales bacterium]|nr:pilus assembly protein PilM [Sedimentisphaerales bacterium]